MKKDITESTPHYYAALPPKVRYDENLSSSEKIIYAEITSLCYKEGYCWANNTYFADLYKVDKRTISSQISNLEKQGHIKVEIDQENGNKRKIYIDDNVPTYRRKGLEVATNSSIPIDEKVYQSNTISNTSNKTNKDLMSEVKTSDGTPLQLSTNVDKEKDSLRASGSNKKFDKDSFPYMLSELLLTLIQENKPNFYEAKLKPKEGQEKWLQNWAYYIDLMIRADKISPERIEKVIIWCQKDDFWHKNILSTSKLRSQFQNLEMKIVGLHNTEKVKETIPEDEDPETTYLLIKRYGKKFLQNKDFKTDKKNICKFIAASKFIKDFSEKTKITTEHVIDHLLDCLEMQYTNKNEPVFVGHLNSIHTWDILLPQYLKDLGVLWNRK